MFRAIKELFTGKPFDFPTENTLRESYRQLEMMATRKHHPLNLWRNRKRLHHVVLNSVDEHSFQFQASREVAHRLWIIADGCIYKEKSVTHVTGKIRMGRFTRFFVICSLLMIIPFGLAEILMPMMIHVSPLIHVLFTSLLIAELIRMQHKLHKQICAGLDKSAKSKSKA